MKHLFFAHRHTFVFAFRRYIHIKGVILGASIIFQITWFHLICIDQMKEIFKIYQIKIISFRGAAVLKLELIKFTQNWLLVSGKFPRLLLIFAQYSWNQKYKNTLEYSILSILSICAFAWIYDPINALTPAWKMPNNRNEDPREGGQRSHHAKTFYQRFAKCVLFLDQLADCISLGSIAVVVVVVVVSRVCGENSNN